MKYNDWKNIENGTNDDPLETMVNIDGAKNVDNIHRILREI